MEETKETVLVQIKDFPKDLKKRVEDRAEKDGLKKSIQAVLRFLATKYDKGEIKI